jgi:formamidopyrimidine-DNA glycosylase
MSGRFSILEPAAARAARPGVFHYAAAPDPAHTHIVWETEQGVRIEFNDPRRFGYMDLFPTAERDRTKHLARLGPEPLSEDFGAAWLRARFAGRRQSVKATLLDQRVVAGLGNIYVCEALYRAGIDPRRAAGRISAPRLEWLAAAVRAVLQEAIDAGGSSLRDFAAGDGALGYFQHSFHVYDRERAACPRPGCAGAVRRVVQAGRSTFFCAACQR